MTKKPITIDIPIWNGTLYILFSNKNLRAQLKKLQFEDDEIEELLQETCEAITQTNRAEKTVIILNQQDDHYELIDTLTHEIFHATDEILALRDVKLRTNDANEAHAYLMGYLMAQAYRRIFKNKRLTKTGS